MKIKALEENDEKMKFVLADSFPEFANALRRIMISHVPVMAVEYVDIEENSSGLFDEVLSHRIGLIPLAFKPGDYLEKEKCEDDETKKSRCETVLVLDKKGPCTVYSGDFKPTDENVKPIFDTIPIVELLDERSVKLEAVAKLGKATEHAKFQAAVVGYEADSGEKNFTFVLESVCGLKPRKILQSALEVMEKKTKSFAKEVDKIK